jgi:adenine/guanine/hypoxanthine permease
MDLATPLNNAKTLEPAAAAPAAHRSASVAGDLRGGLVTFLGSICIAALIPSMINAGAGSAVTSVAGTALACVLGTLLFAGFTRLPFAVGPGIVPAAIVASYLANGIPFATVMGIELIAGALFAAMVAFGVIGRWVRRMPALLKTAGQIAIGLYLLKAALHAAGVIGPDGISSEHSLGLSAALFVGGFIVALLLAGHRRLGAYAALIGVAVVAAGAAFSGLSSAPQLALVMPDFSFTTPDLLAAFDTTYIDEIAILLYVVVVDVVATFETLASCERELQAADGRLRNFDKAMQMSAAVFMISPFLGTAPMLVFFETLGGVLSGARGVIAALVVALGFGLVMLMAPLATALPAAACAVALAFVGWSIARHAASGLPRAADGEAQATVGWILAAAALAMVAVSGSLAITLFALFALYPIATLIAGQTAQRGDMVAAAMAGLLVVSMVM